MLKPSGRTAEEILLKYRHHLTGEAGICLTEAECQRQLFNAICSEVIGEDDSSATEDNSSPTDRLIQSVRNEFRAELRQRLRVFFNQEEK